MKSQIENSNDKKYVKNKKTSKPLFILFFFRRGVFKPEGGWKQFNASLECEQRK
jgi:hypothetical protein